MLLDYVSHVSICSNLKGILKRTPEWEEISTILSKIAKKTYTIRQGKIRLFFMFVCVSVGNPRPLQHLCRLVIRSRMSIRTLNDPEAVAAVPFPPRMISYLTYREYDLYGKLSST